MIKILTTLFLASAIVVLPSTATGDARTELDLAEAMLTDAAIRGDRWALDSTFTRLDQLFERAAVQADSSLAARMMYDRAVTGWALSMTLAADQERAQVTARRMMADLERATDLEPQHGAAWALISRGHYMLYSLGIGDANTMRGMTSSRARAVETDPTHPVVMLNEGIMDYYTPAAVGGDETRGMATMRSAIDALKQRQDPLDRYWFCMGHTMLGQMLLGRGDVEQARAIIENVLAVRPDYALVRDTMLPMTQPVTSTPHPELEGMTWTELAADAEHDAAAPELPDARRLSYAFDKSNGRLWLRIDLYGGIDPKAFGINVPIDHDHDQSTGASWWGGNTGFTWDRLVTVWVVHTKSGYHGAVGIGDTSGVAEGRYLNLGRGDVVFDVDPEQKSMYVGFDPENLTIDDRLTLIGVVGSNTRWSDAIVDEGSVTIDLS